MVLKKVLQLFGVVKKDTKKGKSIDPLWQVAAPHTTVNVNANRSLLDPCSSGIGTVLPLQKHETECSSIISSMTRTEHGSDTDDYMSFNQFDVVQDFSDHHYAKHSPGKTTKDWVKTIQNEWKLLQKDLPDDGSLASVAERKGLPSPCQQANSSQGRGAETMEPELTLPEDILYKIHALPLLPMREAARAACLSRGFLHSWRCCPNLIFDMRALGKTEDACKKDETRADAISVVNRVMPNK